MDAMNGKLYIIIASQGKYLQIKVVNKYNIYNCLKILISISENTFYSF